MLSACGSSTPLGGSITPAAGGGDAAGVKTFKICPGPDAQKETLIALFDSHEGDTIEFCEGQFDFDTGLVMTGKRGITLKGAGRDKTVLSFLNSESQDGVNINRVTGITVQGLTIYDAHDNGPGFLVFDLPGRAQFGEKNLVHHNVSFNNNTPTFAPRGAIVGDVPSGTGMLLLAGDQLELYDNDIHDNNFTGFAIANYGLIDPNESSTEYDFYPEGLHVY